MKEIQHKKILKEGGVLLLIAIMVLSTVAVTANTNNESPEFLAVIGQEKRDMFETLCRVTNDG